MAHSSACICAIVFDFTFCMASLSRVCCCWMLRRDTTGELVKDLQLEEGPWSLHSGRGWAEEDALSRRVVLVLLFPPDKGVFSSKMAAVGMDHLVVFVGVGVNEKEGGNCDLESRASSCCWISCRLILAADDAADVGAVAWFPQAEEAGVDAAELGALFALADDAVRFWEERRFRSL